ncbi:MAG: type III-B CRISPR module RAMP protein Cmr6 [Thermosphaera sp.]
MAHVKKGVSARENNRDEGRYCLKECFESSAIPIYKNIASALNKSFVECFLRCADHFKDVAYVSEFSKHVSERLMKIYECGGDAKVLLDETKKYIDNLEQATRQAFWGVFRYEASLQSRLTVHGSSHHLPLEISLAWDPLFNVPYIPSSSIRGVVRAFYGENDSHVADLFGDVDHMSNIVFFDAYPVRCEGRSLIEADVITPHYVEIAGRMDEARSSPIPLIFPVLAPGTVLHILVALKRPVENDLLSDFVNKVGKALESGLGARTSVGYGRICVKVLNKED